MVSVVSTVPTVLTAGQVYHLILGTEPLAPWWLIVSWDTCWTDHPTPLIELVSFAELDVAFLGASGVASATGIDGRYFTVPTYPAFLGTKIVLSLIQQNPTTGIFRWSNTQTSVVMP